MTAKSLVTEASFLAHETLRESQVDMINDGLQAIGSGGYLFANAPTGIGKTAASLSAALTVSRQKPGQHVLFMTGRQSQHRIVVDTVRNINARIPEGEVEVTLVDMIGRESMCEYVDRSTGKCSCEQGIPESERHNRRYALVQEILSHPQHVEFSIEFASKRRICAWAAARQAAADADILVCDYNHVFLESVRKASLPSMGIELENCIIVVDEAHNLPDRIRRSMNLNLNFKMIRDAIYNLQEYCETNEKRQGENTMFSESIARSRYCEKALERFKGRFSTWTQSLRDSNKKSGDIGEAIEEKVDAGKILSMLRQELSKEDLDVQIAIGILRSVEIDADDEEEDELDAHRLANFFDVLERYEQSSALCVVFNSQGNEHRVTTHLLDPGIVSQSVLDTVQGGILMSGTLTPPEMYAETLGVPPERPVVAQSYPSPFMADRRPVMIASDVTSKYTARGEANTRKIREHIQAILQQTPGHVAIFCQSYRMLEEIVVDGYWPGRKIAIEEKNWSKRIVDKNISNLYNARDGGTKVILAGVFGGRLAEGVDYSGNILDAVICVGIPVAPQTVPQTALREYIDNKHGRGKGWKYGVLQPAVNSVLQGIGRAIRKAEDRAFILLLDNRLLSGQYRACLPPTMQTFTADDSKRTTRMVKRFFERHPEPARGD
ncbi:MAG: hypothetical protein CMB52_00905 [Euryarchaeota archaeon]|nr:hypothetical protein [Euryarchaeota archaeon]|tara:strand:+ start:100 stop:2091 length:1992 start_codon:yes stop_codon:yes gene_type:complete